MRKLMPQNQKPKARKKYTLADSGGSNVASTYGDSQAGVPGSKWCENLYSTCHPPGNDAGVRISAVQPEP